MNQPTEDRFKRLEEEQRQLKEEVRKLKEQMTEPIKITRLEIDSGCMHKQLDSVQEDTNILKIEMSGARADISNVKATQSDHSAFHIEHGQRLSAIETKQDAHTEVLGQIVNLSEGHTKRFDRIEETMATKDDITAIKNDVGRLEKIMMQILDRLPQPEGE